MGYFILFYMEKHAMFIRISFSIIIYVWVALCNMLLSGNGRRSLLNNIFPWSSRDEGRNCSIVIRRITEGV